MLGTKTIQELRRFFNSMDLQTIRLVLHDTQIAEFPHIYFLLNSY